MSDDKRGLYTKYVIFKREPCPCGADKCCQNCQGEGFHLVPTNGEAEYFVLRLDKDEAARVAVASYAAMIDAENPALSGDIMDVLSRCCIGQADPPLLTWNAGKAAKREYHRGHNCWQKVMANPPDLSFLDER